MRAKPFITPSRLFISGLAIILISSALTLAWFANRLIKNAEQEIESVAELKHRHIESQLFERRADARVFAQLPFLKVVLASSRDQKRDTAAIPESYLSLIENFEDAYGYASLHIVDARGTEVFTTEASKPTDDAMKRIAETLADAQPRIVDLHTNSLGLVVYGYTHPVFANEPNGQQLIGAVYLETDAQVSLFSELSIWPIPRHRAEIILFRRDGDDVLYFNSPVHTPEIKPLTLRKPMVDADLMATQILQESEIGVISGHDYRGVDVLGSGRKIEGTDWFLAAKIDRTEVLKPVSVLAGALSAISIAGLLLFSLLARLVSRLQKQKTKEAEDKINQRYRVALNNSIDSVVVLDDKGNVIDWNPALQRLLGYTPDEMRTKTIADLRFSISPSEIENLFSKIRAEGKLRYITQWVTKSKVKIDVDISVTFVPGVAGQGRYFAAARDITKEIAAHKRLEHLNRVLSFLNATNAAIRDLRDISAILDAACRAACDEGQFKLVWAAIPNSDGVAHAVSAYGEAAEYARKIVITTDPVLPSSHGPTGMALRFGTTVIVNDFQADQRTITWRETASRYGLAASLTVPIVVDGAAIAAIMFYADTTNFFTQEVLELIQRAQESIALACTIAKYGDRIVATQEKADSIERRYETIFESSPVAMQILLVSDSSQLRINDAHQALFGYLPEDLPSQAAWFSKMYPDKKTRDEIIETWNRDLERARSSHQSITSPMLTLRRKDGSPRIVQGKVTVVGDDVVVAWTDLTEREEQARVLRQGEARFRGLIEQTITGTYVVRHRKLQYVNPMFEKISGYKSDELIGRDPRFFVAEGSLSVFDNARSQLEAGATTVDLIIQIVRKDGELRDVTIHAAKSSWDGNSAIIAILLDISEQKRAAEKIAAYLRQLKFSMEGTLKAVAKMVDFRDPYTAGHERRVGIICEAIGREMGLEDERCIWLNWAGLVHDIGKIAIPAELLSKPTQLTKIEHDLIKGHAEAGYEILKDIEFPAPIAEMARQHHECMDGSGYPRGLKGDEILLEARILAVADALESMTSHRPYRPGLGIERAISEIEAHRGTRYDAPVVDAALRLLRAKGWAIPK